MTAAKKLEDRELCLDRTFDAPPDLVWRTFTDPKHLDQWWGPNGFRNETHAMDFRVGGTWRYTMHGPDGKPWINWIRYTAIVPGERLEYDHGGDVDETMFKVTITFETSGKKTHVTMRSVFPTAEALASVMKYGVVEGGKQTLARLAGHLPNADETERAVIITRLYDAPVAKVFAAWTKAEALKQWWGPKGMTTPQVELDFRVGGKFRMVMKDANAEYPFHGTFLEIVPNARIVFDSVIEGPNVEVLTTVTFVEEADGKTRLTAKQTRPADAQMAKGQVQGWSGQLEKLAELLAR